MYSFQLISCSINASCLALLNAGIDMKFLIAGVGCVLGEDDILRINPGPLQYAHSKAIFEFVFESVDYKLLASHTSGSFTLDIYENALKKCREASGQVFSFYKKVILEKCQ